jgi:hypothetical protein
MKIYFDTSVKPIFNHRHRIYLNPCFFRSWQVIDADKRSIHPEIDLRMYFKQTKANNTVTACLWINVSKNKKLIKLLGVDEDLFISASCKVSGFGFDLHAEAADKVLHSCGFSNKNSNSLVTSIAEIDNVIFHIAKLLGVKRPVVIMSFQ